MKKVLGLDASSTTIGIALIQYDDVSSKLVYSTYYKPPKKGTVFERMSQVRSFIQEIIDQLKPDDVALEDIVLYMNPKGHAASTAKTITTLAVLNRTVGTAVFDKTQKSPYLYNAMRIRHAIKLDNTLPAKKDIPELVAQILEIKFPYIQDSKGKLKTNRKGEIVKENEDIADAIACAICHVLMDRKNLADKLQIKKKKKRKKKKS